MVTLIYPYPENPIDSNLEVLLSLGAFCSIQNIHLEHFVIILSDLAYQSAVAGFNRCSMHDDILSLWLNGPCINKG